MPLKEHTEHRSKMRYGAKPLGDEQYLWILVALEVIVLGWGRYASRRLHGG